MSTITGATVYVLYNNMFMRATGGTIGGNKAYIALPTGSAARSLTIGTTTSMHNAQCTMHNEAGPVFDLQGRKVSTSETGGKLRKGVYVIDGKKRVVK